MVQNVNATFVKTPNNSATQITTGTGAGGLATVYTGGVNGSKVAGLIATSFNTTSAYDLQWGLVSGSTSYIYGTVLLPVGAGSTDTIPAVNLFNSTALPGLTIDSDGNPFIILASTAWALFVKSPATSSTWTSGVAISIVAPVIGDF